MPMSVQKPRILDTLEIESNTSRAIWWWLEMVVFKCSAYAPTAIGDTCQEAARRV